MKRKFVDDDDIHSFDDTDPTLAIEELVELYSWPHCAVWEIVKLAIVC